MWTIVPLVISAAYLPSTNFTNWHFKKHLVRFIFSRTKVSWTSLKVDPAHCRIQELSGGPLASEQGVGTIWDWKGFEHEYFSFSFGESKRRHLLLHKNYTWLFFCSLLTHKSQNALVFQGAKKIPISNSFWSGHRNYWPTIHLFVRRPRLPKVFRSCLMMIKMGNRKF